MRSGVEVTLLGAPPLGSVSTPPEREKKKNMRVLRDLFVLGIHEWECAGAEGKASPVCAKGLSGYASWLVPALSWGCLFSCDFRTPFSTKPPSDLAAVDQKLLLFRTLLSISTQRRFQTLPPRATISCSDISFTVQLFSRSHEQRDTCCSRRLRHDLLR